MEGIYLVNYKLNGIKTLDRDVDLSFYKRVIKRPIDFKDYNIKGIYGMNGTGKTSIVTSVKFLKSFLLSSRYLSNDINQKKLNNLINKNSKSLNIVVDFLVDTINRKPSLYRYNVHLMTTKTGKVYIKKESLVCKNAASYNSEFRPLIEIEDGKIIYVKTNSELEQLLIDKTTNLLSESSICCLFIDKIYHDIDNKNELFLYDEFFFGITALFAFGYSLYAYLDDNDIHDDYIIRSIVFGSESFDKNIIKLIQMTLDRGVNEKYNFNSGGITVSKEYYKEFKADVNKLYGFLNVFKKDLIDIHIDKRENGESYSCKLELVYNNYKIDSEFESTGIKKLIKLYQYIQKMVDGNIVFIDEFDSNLHDVYLCALLEYLSEYGSGQLCFTSHNIGPMSVLKSKKKSIDFLSVDKTIYSWSKSGNYSPATLYREGMIEGSPFNIDLTDFIGVFD